MTNGISTATVGRHSELLATTALLANGYTVLEPVVPEPFDLAVTRKGERNIVRAQVKTAQFRNKDGTDWYITKAVRHNGKTYTKEDCDIFIAIIGNRVFMFDNREITEYWVKPEELTEKWTELPTGLNDSRTYNEVEAV